jgi:hypothetical protein
VVSNANNDAGLLPDHHFLLETVGGTVWPKEIKLGELLSAFGKSDPIGCGSDYPQHHHSQKNR